MNKGSAGTEPERVPDESPPKQIDDDTRSTGRGGHKQQPERDADQSTADQVSGSGLGRSPRQDRGDGGIAGGVKEEGRLG